MGSGSLAAMAVFEAGYKDDLTQAEAIDIVEAAIQAGIDNDLGSGSNIDICVIDKTSGVDMKRNYKGKRNERHFERADAYKFPKGTVRRTIAV
jgi:20S proteasome subunit beta 2